MLSKLKSTVVYLIINYVLWPRRIIQTNIDLDMIILEYNLFE